MIILNSDWISRKAFITLKVYVLNEVERLYTKFDSLKIKLKFYTAVILLKLTLWG